MNEIATALHSLLATNIISFTFRKVNGELRHAKGTRNLDLARNHTGEYIPTPKGAEQPNSYYDVEAMGWRSYKPENLISIDGVVARTDTDFAKKPTSPNEPKKGELPKREIPVKFHTADGTDIPIGTAKTLGNPTCEELPIGNGKSVRVKMQPVDLSGLFGGGIPMGEIRKSMDKLNKDIEIVPLGGKVGTPTFTDKGVELEMGIGVEDFAKMVAHYVVEEFINRLK